MLATRAKSGQQGFGLLEALVALVLFSGVGIVAIAWLQQSLSASVKMQRSLEESRARKIMLDTVTSVNLALQANGSIESGDYTIEWRSEPVGRMEPQIGYPIGTGRHQVQLYSVTVLARHRIRTQEVIQERLMQVGDMSFNNKTLGMLP